MTPPPPVSRRTAAIFTALAGLPAVILFSTLVKADAAPAEPHQIFIGQPVSAEDEGRWSEAEGIVTFDGRQGTDTTLELRSGAGHMRVKVSGTNGIPAGLLLKSRVRVDGWCARVYDGTGGGMAGFLSSPGWDNVTLLQIPQETWVRFDPQTIASVTGPSPAGNPDKVIHLRGKVHGPDATGGWRIADATGTLPFNPTPSTTEPDGSEVEMLGTVELQATSPVFLPAISRITGAGKSPDLARTILTTTEQIRWLKPNIAAKRLPVRLRAVVTFLLETPGAVDGNLQDDSGGIYAWHLVASPPGIKVHPGDYCEIEGDTSAGAFSPGVYCHRLKVLGPGEFPEPLRPTWGELVSGSLDAQWVEIEGIALSAPAEHLEIGTQGGHISCFVSRAEGLDRFLNAVVRVRGVAVADWDQTRHVQGVHLNVPSGEFISVETPPPDNPSLMPARQIKDLLFYDPGEPAFRRDKVTGQIVGQRDRTYYLMNGTNGLRLHLKEDAKLTTGDLVEAVGFPEIDNSAGTPLLTLREAEVRVTGHQALPAPVTIPLADLPDSAHDATLVTVQARLVNTGVYGADQVLELQAGARTFFARLDLNAGRLPPLLPDSRLDLTGVYVFDNGSVTAQVASGPFELLLNSPADVRVLELPSWWTLRRAVMVISGMALLLLLGLVWISLLRQQVGRRTAQLSAANRSLEEEIAERKRAENELVRTRLQHLLEQERTRIARDIHDELGCSLSQIRLLSEMARSQDGARPQLQTHAGQISAKALEATHVLDEIVWAVDPQNDTLESLLSYLFSFASEYLALAGIRFRVDAPAQMPHHTLTTQVRHQFYMAVKEMLTNIVKHANASEVWIRLRLEPDAACFTVEDNGRGFDLSAGMEDSPGASGLENMRQRFNEIGGQLTVESAPDRGACVKFVLPLGTEKK